VTLIDGAYPDIVSSALAFGSARAALREALQKGSPLLRRS
jgi:hypothetical protein